MVESCFACDHSWNVEPGDNGAVLVRVPSCDPSGDRLPDAVFTFRPGDPQYDRWLERLHQRAPTSPPPSPSG